MISSAFATIEKYDMFKNSKKVVVGFSGGADSTALLHFLHFFVSDSGKKFKIEAVHVNHGLRGDEALRDENFVQKFCGELGIKLTVKRIDLKNLSAQMGLGLEEAGRKARYEIFESLAWEEGSKIATAHTLSDSCETFVLNLTRGTALKGLCGIPAVRDNIVRPLINCSRPEIEEYCQRYKLNYITDSSNFEKIYTRNKIRLDMIPFFKNLNPDFEKTLSRTMSTISEDEKYMDEESEKIFNSCKIEDGYSMSVIKNLPIALKNRVIVKIIKNCTNKSLEYKHVQLIGNMTLCDSSVTLPGNVIVKSNKTILRVLKKNTQNNIRWSYPFQLFNSLTEIKTNIIIKVIPFCKYQKISSEIDKKNVLDFEKIPKESIIRNRREKDVFTLPFRNVTKNFKKLMNEFKIPKDSRNEIPLIAYGNEVIWIDGVGVSARYIPDKKTKKIAIIYKELYRV